MGVWVLWFVTHLPWLGIREQISIPAIVGVWFLCFVVAGRNLAHARAWQVGALAGFVSAFTGLAVVGSKLRPQVEGGGPADPSLTPSAPAIVLGFLVFGTVLGLAGAFLGSRFARPAASAANTPWLARFAWVACLAAAPLLFVGGLVTSTDAGMAVPDWPNTYGSNMFLYPLGPRVPANIYLEHAHRLFGTLVGFAAIILTVWVWVSRTSSFVKWWATGLLLFIIAQGLLGAARVLENSRWMAAFHGVSAQVIFAGMVALAVYLSPWYAGLAAGGAQPGARRLRAFATATLHTLFIQLALGAVYRQFRHTHVLWTHAAFATVVLLVAIIAGFAAMSFLKDASDPRPGARVRRAGGALVGVVAVQFVLGWIAFMVTAGQSLDTSSVPQALVRTAHQANGALLIGVVAYLVVIAKQLARATPPVVGGVEPARAGG
ncbi:MAG: COX15/CtaA family protein [Planctomycetota bacterium]|nr:COX15/CtaA family protein [Planctomycetota bacterium]